MKISNAHAKAINKILVERLPKLPSPEELLWMEVITQSVTDLSLPTTTTSLSQGTQSRTRMNNLYQDDAANFIFGKSNFNTICYTVGLNPEWVRDLIKTGMEQQKVAA